MKMNFLVSLICSLTIYIHSVLAVFPIRNPDSSVNIDSLVDHVKEIEKTLASSKGHDAEIAALKVEVTDLKALGRVREAELDALKKQFHVKETDLEATKMELKTLKAQTLLMELDFANLRKDVSSGEARILQILKTDMAALNSTTNRAELTTVKNEITAMKAQVRQCCTCQSDHKDIAAIRSEVMSMKSELRYAEGDIQHLQKSPQVCVPLNATSCSNLGPRISAIEVRLNATETALSVLGAGGVSTFNFLKEIADLNKARNDLLSTKKDLELAVKAFVDKQKVTEKEIGELKGHVTSLDSNLKLLKEGIALEAISTNMALDKLRLNQHA